MIYLQSFMLSGPYVPATPNAGAESDDGKFLILSIFQNELSLIVKIRRYNLCIQIVK